MSPRSLFLQELDDLKSRVRSMGEQVECSYSRLLYAWKAEDAETLKQLRVTDRQVLELQRGVEGQCLMLMTRQQPVAGDLRLVTAALKIVTDIERVSDHVGDLAELCLRMNRKTMEKTCVDLLDRMYLEAKEMFCRAVDAFENGSVEEAEKVVAADCVVDDCFNRMKEHMMEVIRSRSMDADCVVDCLMAAKYLEKVGDHAVNIGEWAVFERTGDIAGVKIY